MTEKISRSTIMKAPYLNRERLAADIGNLMVLAPHPDDESLGCGGLIALLKEAGRSVSVVFVTSGSASHPDSRSHPPETLSKLRESEAIKACSELGVPVDDIHFVRALDSRLKDLDQKSLSEIAQQVAEVFENKKLSALAVPWRRDPHPDHVTTHALGDMVLDRVPAKAIKMEYPIWLWKNGRKGDWPKQGETVPYRLDISPVFQKKWQAVQMHRSQLGEIIKDDDDGFVLTAALLEPFNTPTEYFFMTNLRNLKTLEKRYFEQLYSENSDPWNFRNSEYEKQKYKNCIKILGTEAFESGLELGCSIGIQTRMLSRLCHRLTAVDISKEAIGEATRNRDGMENIEFRVADITKEFPYGDFDLVTCCEIGYYLEMEDLVRLFQNISDSLVPEGRLLMVHWTPFVPDYPLSGDAVHDSFADFAIRTGLFDELVHERHELYRLQVWRKSSGKSIDSF